MLFAASKRQVRLLGSLELRLPITIGLLLASVVVIMGAAAFREVRLSAREQARQRIRTVADAMSDVLSDNSTQRASALFNAGTTAGVQAAFAGDLSVVRAMIPGLTRLRERDSSLLAIELRKSNGQILLSSTSDSINALDEVALHSLLAIGNRDSATVGPLYAVGSQLNYWLLIPVGTGGTHVGYIAERRRFSGFRAEELLRSLTGQQISLYYATSAGEVWSISRDGIAAAPFNLFEVDGEFDIRVDGESMLGLRAPLKETGWELVYMIPESAITGRAVALAKRSFPFAIGLMLVGAFAGWLISRRVTRPLSALAIAADSIAGGDYSRRVQEPQDEELRRLALAFNHMAERIGVSHHELEVRNDELRTAQMEAIAARIASDSARIEAQRANEAKTSFLAMMSHELRTPLSAIGGYTEILQLGLRGPLTETQLADLERIRSNQAHLLTIINDMLDLSQIESGQLSVHMESVALEEVLAQVEPIVAPHIARKRLGYTVDSSVHNIRVSADAERLRQILVNLVSNAARYSESGGEINITASAYGETVTIAVCDTGIGIPEDKIESIFEPFIQVDSGPTRRTGSTGLGLPISRRLAQAMDGTLCATSELGVGSTFSLTLRISEPVGQRGKLRLISDREKQIA